TSPTGTPGALQCPPYVPRIVRVRRLPSDPRHVPGCASSRRWVVLPDGPCSAGLVLFPSLRRRFDGSVLCHDGGTTAASRRGDSHERHGEVLHVQGTGLHLRSRSSS